MNTRMIERRRFSAALSGALLASCSGGGGPVPPKTGTPAYYFQNAKEAYGKGDYAKALDWLEKITRANKNDFTDRAWAMRLLITSGLLGAYRDLTENYEYGQRANKNNPTPFIKKVSDYRGMATRMSLQFGESYAEYDKAGPPAETTLDFPFPAVGGPSKPQPLTKIATGLVPKDEDVASALTAMIHRGVVLAMCDVTGSKEDAGKARAAMQNPPLKVPRGAFELVMAKTLYDGAKLYGPKLGGNPAVREFLAKQALKAMASVTSTEKEVKELKAKLEKELKEAAKK